MLQFTKLRLSGFKSFVDPTELLIEPGMTGIVGPNGCGKSNLVEALRWVMGETSAKQMRGGEMDDVIFGGTADRPPRNIAEVLLDLDNATRVAPPQYNDFDDLSVSRRIEREKGSTYRVNGKEVRARDVQLLFADSATGARSPALVSQGRVGTVINAKPTDRRVLLEEAAGITGLHSRRHEAELRLRGAETNLARLDDVLVTLEAQLQGLKKQVRQASRYRNLSDLIRRAEATLFHLRWRAAIEQRDHHRQSLAAINVLVSEMTGAVARASTGQAEAAAGLPELRDAEAKAAAELQRLVLAREALETEEQRVVAAQRDCRTRLDQVAADTERERILAADAEAALRRLEAEQAEIEAAQQGEEDAQTAAAERLEAASREVEELDGRLTALTEKVAADEASRTTLTRRLGELGERRDRLTARQNDITAQRAALEAEMAATQELQGAEQAVAGARESLDMARAEAERAETDRAAALQAAEEEVSALQAARAVLTQMEAEEKALADVLAAGDSSTWPPLIDSVTVEPGFEAALGAALGEDLSAPVDEAAPVHWRSLPPLSDVPALPGGVAPLAGVVRAPEALARRLACIGVVDDSADGDRLAAELRPGQRLVGRDGALWRWDGFTMAAGAPTAAAARLQQRNRLREVRAGLERARAEAGQADQRVAAARQAAEAAATAEREARTAAHDAANAHTAAQDRLTELKGRAAENASRLSALAETADALVRDLAECEQQATEAAATLEALPDPTAARETVTALRTELSERRAVQADIQATHTALVREAEQRRRRLADIARETASWRERRAGAGSRIDQLDERRQAVTEELQRLEGRPAEIAAQRQGLLSALEESEAKRRAAADRLAEAETRLGEADGALRKAETDLAQAREERVRAEGAVEQADQACRGLAERIAERLDCRPDDLREIAGLAEDAALPDLRDIEQKVDRLQRERDNMGPVNLRAEQEAQELTEQMQTLQSERDDLIQAIGKLRQGINELNREGRQRLLASFREVDEHFRKLFERLFGGGRAHLQMVESDDPLEAGLEIMASPPGKRLQVLSLLSGGEQALTALALLFAVFLTNPAPICVLDEVDAPLDDANVDRFCSLVDEISQSSHTRFMVITHHRMTMARMDRLFGVTMSERGVSQLVSVNLQQAEAMRATA